MPCCRVPCIAIRAFDTASAFSRFGMVNEALDSTSGSIPDLFAPAACGQLWQMPLMPHDIPLHPISDLSCIYCGRFPCMWRKSPPPL